MSKKRVRDLKDLKDSSLLYEKDVPPFGYIIVSGTALLLVAVIIWSVNTTKTYVIKSSGIIESENKNYIMPSYSGEISEMYIDEGSYVKKGDVIGKVVFQKYLVVDDDKAEGVRMGGFGSTDEERK